MTANQRRRSGVTLMEVMVATGILAIGLVCIMALFPIGAVNMARAITQDRSATHGVNSDQMFRFYWKQAWNDPSNGTTRASNAEAYYYSQEPVLFALENHPNSTLYGLPGVVAGYGNIPVALSQPSFPVLVDPVGTLTNTGANQAFIAGQPSLPVRTTLRRCINFNAGYPYDPTVVPPAGPVPFPNPPAAYPSIIKAVVRSTALLDDMTFARPGDNSTQSLMGEPADFTGQIERAGRYNAAWLIQRPRNDVPAEANVTVMVFAARSATDTPSTELAFSAAAQLSQKSIVLSMAAGQALPPLKRGGWIAFQRRIAPPPVPQGGAPAFVPYMTFDFYRVSGINADNPGSLILETEVPIKLVRGDLAGQIVSGTAVVFDNLVEVFDRGTVSALGVTGR